MEGCRDTAQWTDRASHASATELSVRRESLFCCRLGRTCGSKVFSLQRCLFSLRRSCVRIFSRESKESTSWTCREQVLAIPAAGQVGAQLARLVRAWAIQAADGETRANSLSSSTDRQPGFRPMQLGFPQIVASLRAVQAMYSMRVVCSSFQQPLCVSFLSRSRRLNIE